MWFFICFDFIWIKIFYIDRALWGEVCYRMCTHPHTHTKVFRCVINCMRKWIFWLHFFPTQLPVFEQDIWLYYMRSKQHFFLSVFFRFSLMLAIYEKKLFVWFAWPVTKYKNSFISFLSGYALLILDLSSEAATRGVL